MTNNNTIPHDHHHQETDQLQALAVKPPVVKRQTRRRTHTSRPYQERLLNMAEARREIVTALKIHRASTTRQQQQQQSMSYQHHHEPPPPPQRQPPLQQQQQQVQQVVAFHQDRRQAGQAAAVDDKEASLAAHTTMSYYAAASFANNNPSCSSPPAHWIAAAGSGYCSPPPILRLPCDLITPPQLPLPSAAMGGLEELEHYYQGGCCLERLVRSLPAQPLGLNLSFEGFGAAAAVDDDGAKDDDCEDLFGSFPFTQPSPAASYSSYSPPPAVVETATTHACRHGSPALSAAAGAENHSVSVIDAPTPPALIPAPDDGTQGVEWSEAAAADMAAWWSKIFESEQRAPPTTPNADDVAATAAGLTAAEWRWLCGDDDVGAAEQAGVVTAGGVLATTMHVVDDGDYSCCYEGGHSDDGEDVSLPCMDSIGDNVQGWEREWFSSCS